MNALIKWAAENNLSSVFAVSTDVISVIIFVIFCWMRAPLYKLSKGKAAIIIVSIIPVAYIGSYILFWAETGFRVWGATNIIRIYIWMIFFSWVFSNILNLQFNTIPDFLAPGIMLTFAITHLGCVFEGCCEGYPSDWGIYNRYTGLLHFPVQIIESICAFIIFIILEKYQSSNPEKAYGKLYPLFLILCGAMRFLTSFLREDEKLVWGMSSLSFHSLSMIIVGILWFHYSKKHPSYILEKTELDRLKKKRKREKKHINNHPVSKHR